MDNPSKPQSQGRVASPDVSGPRAVSLDRFNFNFTVESAEYLRAQMGPPAFAVRAKRTASALDEFWRDTASRYQALWLAALGGRIAEDGREVRQSLLDDEGRDAIGELDHARRLFRERVDPEIDRCESFNRAWLRHVEHCPIETIQLEVEEHNRYFPIEANLSIDLETGAYLWMGRPWVPVEAPNREEVLRRFPLRNSGVEPGE